VAHLVTKVMADLEVPIPFLEGCSLVAGYGDDENIGRIEVDFFSGYDLEPEREYDEGQPEVVEEIAGPPTIELAIRADIFSLRFSRDRLKPVEITRDGAGHVIGYTEREGTVDINLGTVTFLVTNVGGDWAIDLEWSDEAGGSGISIPTCMIADTGVIIEARDIAFNLSGSGARPAHAPSDWKGIYIGSATVYIPSVMNGSIAAQDLGIGYGGLYGHIQGGPWEVECTGLGCTGDIAGTVLGMPGGLTSVDLEFVQSIPVAATIKGKILLPFFDEAVDVEIGLDLDGGFSVKLDRENGLYTLTKRDLLRLELESLGFEVKNGEFATKLAGTIQPLVAGVTWPAVQITEMTIYADGRVDLDGGWLNLPEQFQVNFHGFSAELTQLGFGETDDHYRWIGFSGSIQLVADLGLGARFDRLRIEWPTEGEINADTIRLKLEGVGVDLTIPDVLSFKGQVRFIDDNGEKGFKGGVKLILYSINLEIDAEILVIRTGGFTAFYIYVNTDFPAGIPLASTGIAIYGLAGLYGQNVEPDKTPEEMWYENWYKGKRLAGGSTDPGVVSSSQWQATQGSMAFGAGVTLGTVSDNGFAVNGKLLLVLILPGPIILLEGRANLLTERKKLGNVDSEPTFEALAVLDNRAGQFLLNVAAQYKKDSEGRIIDIRAGAEVFFDYRRSDAWHLYLGQDEPREKRIRAAVLSLFRAESYFMLSARDLRLGFWAGFDERWEFGPLRVGLSAWVAADVAVSWKPIQVGGQLQLHGGFELSAFGFGLSIEVDARIAAQTPKPFEIVAELEVKLKLPWPLPDLEASVTLEWSEAGDPPWPLALGAASCEHLKASEKWPLDRWPRYDTDTSPDGLWNNEDPLEDVNEIEILDPRRIYDEDDPDHRGYMGVPVVPLDVRPVLTFTKPMFDDLDIDGVRREGLVEKVGEYEYEYHLVDLTLHKKPLNGGGWEEVAADQVYGTWQEVNDGSDRLPNVRLMLWAKTPFEWLDGGGGGGAGITGHDRPPEADCPPPSPQALTCVDWDDVPTRTRYDAPFIHDGLAFSLAPATPPPATLPMDVVYRPRAAFGRLHALRLPAQTCCQTVPVRLTIAGFPYGTTEVTLRLDTPQAVRARGYSRGNLVASPPDGAAGLATITLEATAIDTVVVEAVATPQQNAYLYWVCFNAPLNPERQKAVDEWVSAVDVTRRAWHMRVPGAGGGNTSRLSQRTTGSAEQPEPEYDDLLEPDHYYRLTVETKVIRRNGDNGEEPSTFTEKIYWQTGQPPGVYDPPPDDQGESQVHAHEHYSQKGPLKDLSAYVEYTVPAPEARAVYRAYDIGAHFNANYVKDMYQLAGKPLRVFVYDAQGQPVANLVNRWDEDIALSQAGNTTAWGRLSSLPAQTGKFAPRAVSGVKAAITLSRAEAAWLYSLDQAPCLEGIDLAAVPPDDHLNASGLLRPETLYQARLVADGGQGQQYPVYKWRFITSRFAHFRHHIGSFRELAWDEHLIRGRPETPLLTEQQLSDLETLLGNADDAQRFEQIAAMFVFGTAPAANQPGRWLRPAPQRVEVTLLRDATRRYGLLLESPEPLDPQRVGIMAQYDQPVILSPDRPGVAKLLDAHLVRGDAAVNDEYVDILLLQDQDLSGWSLEHTASNYPPNAAFVAYYSFPPNTGVFKEGTLIRVHSGRAADDPLGDRPPTYKHRYAEGVNKLNSTGDRLRLVDARGNTVHQRFFRPSDAYTGRDMVAVWNADRTTAFLFFPDGETRVGTMPDGQYRLVCTFRRTVEAEQGQPSLPQLRQANDTTDEQAHLEVVVGAENFQFLVGDVNQDGVVGVEDVEMVADGWREPVTGENDPRDLNDDGVINVIDVQTAAGNLGARFKP